MNPATTLFYDVDTQRDFLLPGSPLFVTGADRIIPALKELTALARQRGFRIVASTDRHFPDDPELKRSGGDFDDHCMDGTEGQRKIDETAPLNPLFVENRDYDANELKRLLAHRGELVIEKQRFDVFTGNRFAEKLLAQLIRRHPGVVVYGVYTEVCVNDAVRGLLRLGAEVTVVSEAIAHIGDNPAPIIAEWERAGVALVTLAELRASPK
ncbi:MAG TPA: isochorismatase family protein [Candidatus Binataceae bacterium]|nr:isochorismatase family protein [Candidatus Binataceae bacterium]